MATRLTSAGVVFSDSTTQGTTAVEFVSGTSMVFGQATAPTGWTKSTTHNNKAFRVVSGVGGGFGGSSVFSSVFSTRTAGGSVDNTTLSESQIPSHNHNELHWQQPPDNEWGNGGGISGKWISANTTDGWFPWAYVSSTGGSGAHNHSFSGGSLDFGVNYIDFIVATKN